MAGVPQPAAFALKPDYYPIHFAALRYLLPQWHGDAREMDSFVRKSMARTTASEGKALYTRLYWYLWQTYLRDELFVR